MGEVVGEEKSKLAMYLLTRYTMPASSGRRFALEISAGLSRLATDRKQSQTKANAQSDDDNLASAVIRGDYDTLFLDVLDALANKVCHRRRCIC